MRRGEIYHVRRPGTVARTDDPKLYRFFVVVSRQVLLDSNFSTATCAPIYTAFHGLPTQVLIGVNEGMVHDCAIACDELVSLPKSALTDSVSALSAAKLTELRQAPRIALAIED